MHLHVGMERTAGEETLADGTMAPNSAPLRYGQQVGRYVVVETLGVGGMGHVFSAYDTVLDRRVALKVLHRSRHADRQRLIREAQALAKLSHPGVVSLYDVGEVQGRVFIVMELVEGCTLRHWLRQPGRTTEEILDAFGKAALGLQAAHDAGIVHRDFKPENVLVGHDGRVRVTDFGLALLAEDTDTLDSSERAGSSSPRLTQTGTVMGTPAYMAIEQHLGLPSNVRSDQFSFCVALFEALYRVRPFAGATGRELCLAIRDGKVRRPAVSSVPTHVHRAVQRGLSADPTARFASMTALMEALQPLSTRPRRRGAVLGLVGVLLGGLSVAAAGPVAHAVAPHVLEVSTASAVLRPGFEQLEVRALRDRVEARRAASAQDCEAAFEHDLGARMLCLDGLNP
mgnify:CR=1 FL=1